MSNTAGRKKNKKTRSSILCQHPLREKAKQNITAGERIAAYAGQCIPALPAKQFGNTIMPEIEGQHYLVYDWIEGSSLYGADITAAHCGQIGNILGRLHNMDFSQLHLPRPETFAEEIVDWNKYLRKGQQAHSPWAQALSNNLNGLYGWNQRYLAAMEYLAQPLVIGHGDIDPKNVMWHNNQPTVIDWESAGYLHPAHEFIVCALYWASVNGKADQGKFMAFLQGYLQSGQLNNLDWHTVMDAGLSPHWLEYSLKRSLGMESADAAEQQMGTEHVFGTIQYLKQYEASIGQITGWLAEAENF